MAATSDSAAGQLLRRLAAETAIPMRAANTATSEMLRSAVNAYRAAGPLLAEPPMAKCRADLRQVLLGAISDLDALEATE